MRQVAKTAKKVPLKGERVPVLSPDLFGNPKKKFLRISIISQKPPVQNRLFSPYSESFFLRHSCILKIENSLAEYRPAAARKGEQVSGHRPASAGLLLLELPCGSSARFAMTGSGDNDTSLQSQAERDQTVAANEEGSARTAAGVKLP